MNCNRAERIWKLSRRSIPLGGRPCLMGILNVTPDSFSDGAWYLDPVKAEDHALRMAADGADIIDIGGESTRPGAAPVTLDEELRRVVPIIERLASTLLIPISVDTTKAEVARAALAAGAEIVNDISGLTFDPSMLDVVAQAQAGVVIMHSRGTPADMQLSTAYENLVAEVCNFLSERVQLATAAGIAAESIVLDPGIGFGKDVAGNVQLLRELGAFSNLGFPVLIGTSRKGFVGKLLGRDIDERLYGTGATVAYGLMQGATIFRLHDVHAMRDLLDMTAVLMGTWPGVQSLSGTD